MFDSVGMVNSVVISALDIVVVCDLVLMLCYDLVDCVACCLFVFLLVCFSSCCLRCCYVV